MPRLLVTSLLPLFLPSAGCSLPAALRPAELQGSLTGNGTGSVPLLFHHLYSPAFSPATGRSQITLCLQGTASAHARASADLRLARFLSSRNKLCFPLLRASTSLRHVQLVLSRSHSPRCFYLQFAGTAFSSGVTGEISSAWAEPLAAKAATF